MSRERINSSEFIGEVLLLISRSGVKEFADDECGFVLRQLQALVDKINENTDRMNEESK